MKQKRPRYFAETAETRRRRLEVERYAADHGTAQTCFRVFARPWCPSSQGKKNPLVGCVGLINTGESICAHATTKQLIPQSAGLLPAQQRGAGGGEGRTLPSPVHPCVLSYAGHHRNFGTPAVQKARFSGKQAHLFARFSWSTQKARRGREASPGLLCGSSSFASADLIESSGVRRGEALSFRARWGVGGEGWSFEVTS